MSSVVQVLRQKGSAVYTIGPGRTVLEAAREMNIRRIGSLVVVDESNAPLGIITERDILTRIVAAAKDPAETAVGDVMTQRVITCSTNTPLDELRSVMRRERIRHVPVVENQRVCGMVSIGDLNNAEVKVMHETIKYFEQYIYGV